MDLCDAEGDMLTGYLPDGTTGPFLEMKMQKKEGQ